jgi:hypothetical protein
MRALTCPCAPQISVKVMGRDLVDDTGPVISQLFTFTLKLFARRLRVGLR